MSNPLSLITDMEMRAIECQINNCAEEALQVEVPYILREWDAQKPYLFKNVFDGNCLIKTQHASFTKSVDQLTSEIDTCWDFMPANAKQFWQDFISFCQRQRRSLYKDQFFWSALDRESAEAEQNWYKCENITSNHVLAANEIDEEFIVNLPKPDGSTRQYHVQKGSKPVRVLGRLMNAYHFSDEEYFKEFSIWHSRMLNEKRIEGDFCLSIHPLDYMTMSENNNEWTSCMNWPEGGCYRGGTVEMMNSPMVIVAYMKSNTNPLMMDAGWDKKNNQRDRLEWNSKKWRTLIVVDKSGIYSVKSYPYAHKEMTQFAMEWIASCFKDRNFNEFMEFYPYKFSCCEDLNIKISPRTFRMYNDFGAANHYAMLDMKNIRDIYSEEDEIFNISFTYSGASECMSCGALCYPNDSNGVYFDGEGSLVCNNCNSNYSDPHYCDICGEAYDGEDLIWVEDTQVCSSCFENECFEDAWEYDYHFNDEGITLYIQDKAGKKIKIGTCYVGNIHRWIKDSNNKDVEQALSRGLNKIIIKESDLSPVGRRHFDNTLRMMSQNPWYF